MQTTISVTEGVDFFLAQYRLQEEKRQSAEPDWLAAQRRQAIQRVQDAGLPATHDEDWRYTNISPITRTQFQTSPAAALHFSTLPAQWDGPVAARLVFINGIFNSALSKISPLPTGTVVGSLQSLLADPKTADMLRVYLGRTIGQERHGFTMLNAALWSDGACIIIPHGTTLNAPIHLVHLSSAEQGPTVCHPRTLIICEREAQLSFIETYQSADEGVSFSNAVTEVVAGENSVIDLHKSVHQNSRSFHVGLLHIYAARGAQLSAFSTAVGGDLVRNEVHAVLDAEGADCTLTGLYAAKGTQHIDNHTTIDHAKPHGASRQFYNGILDGHATGVFNGRVIVRPDAQKTDAVQKNRNLLLSTDATIDTKPQLEISANDVRCTHGATVGQMDQEALFFLRSRGLSRDEAVALLVQAFASEILDKVKIAGYRAWLENELLTKFLDVPAKQGN